MSVRRACFCCPKRDRDVTPTCKANATGKPEQHARQNVVHEAGLFQGRLGFEKAVVMLENGCEEFSNIHGLGQIRFDSGKISAAFHEVSDTLKREGII
jgi:predicted nucleotide-binding protein